MLGVSSQLKIPGRTASVDVSLYTERHLRLVLIVAAPAVSLAVAAVPTVWYQARSWGKITGADSYHSSIGGLEKWQEQMTE